MNPNRNRIDPWRLPTFELAAVTLAAAAALATAVLIATAAQAQVIELGDDGVVRPVGGGWTSGAASARTTQGGPPAAFAAAIRAAADRYDLSPDFLDAVARSESGYDPDAVSPAGAVGVMQLMPATARQLGVDPRDPAQNIMGGAAYLRAQLDAFGGDIDRALAAYNAGAGRVVRYGGVPPFGETQAYVGRNLERLAERSLQAPTPIPDQGELR